MIDQADSLENLQNNLIKKQFLCRNWTLEIQIKDEKHHHLTATFPSEKKTKQQKLDIQSKEKGKSCERKNRDKREKQLILKLSSPGGIAKASEWMKHFQ